MFFFFFFSCPSPQTFRLITNEDWINLQNSCKLHLTLLYFFSLYHNNISFIKHPTDFVIVSDTLPLPKATLFINVLILFFYFFSFSKDYFVFIKLAYNGICLENAFEVL